MIRSLSIAITAVTLIVVAPASFAEEVETVAFEKLSHTQQTTISTAGVEVIQGITGARNSLEKKDGPGARRTLGAAAEQLRIIRASSPSANLGDGVNDLHAQLVKGEGGDPQNLVPLYTRLDAYEDVVGVGAAEEVRAHLDRAKGKLSAGEHEEAAVILVEASESIRYVEIDLPVRETQARVDRALSQIRGKDFIGADANLRESLGSLETFGEMASIQMGEELEAVGAPE